MPDFGFPSTRNDGYKLTVYGRRLTAEARAAGEKRKMRNTPLGEGGETARSKVGYGSTYGVGGGRELKQQ